ncbi:hypothetical protein EZ242_21225 [Ramlibacter rhizophilus]|uniref:Uncharacterized protein n=1 Tax=Ramlibacter rhizophilus TaxID=1781167 RepID=A0A4Z0BBM6_9BURK|nr:hypothetical protein EZ242_21225 [Ramlibacter rhizophilus]
MPRRRSCTVRRRRPTGPARATETDCRQTTHSKETGMKVLFWIVLIIFLIGLAVVLGLGGLIF